MQQPVLSFFVRYGVICGFLVALTIQMYLVFGHDLTAWKGGGFGMFSAIDDREIMLEAVATDGTVYLDFDDTLSRDYRRVRKLPLDRHFNWLVERIETSTWYDDEEDEERLTSTPAEATEAVRLTTLNLSLWEIRYDNKQHLAVPHLMKQKTYALDHPD